MEKGRVAGGACSGWQFSTGEHPGELAVFILKKKIQLKETKNAQKKLLCDLKYFNPISFTRKHEFPKGRAYKYQKINIFQESYVRNLSTSSALRICFLAFYKSNTQKVILQSWIPTDCIMKCTLKAASISIHLLLQLTSHGFQPQNSARAL